MKKIILGIGIAVFVLLTSVLLNSSQAVERSVKTDLESIKPTTATSTPVVRKMESGSCESNTKAVNEAEECCMDQSDADTTCAFDSKTMETEFEGVGGKSTYTIYDCLMMCVCMTNSGSKMVTDVIAEHEVSQCW